MRLRTSTPRPAQVRRAVRRLLDDPAYTRAAARRHFKIDGPSVVVRTLQALAKQGKVPADASARAIEKYRLMDVTAGTSGNAGGEA